MKTMWRLIDTGVCDAYYNMALDEAISEMVLRGSAPPTLRFYDWAVPSVSLGRFQSIKEIDVEYCKENSIPIVRRLTGGRAILHHKELTYSLSARNLPPFFSKGLLHTYRWISKGFYTALKALGLDIQFKNRKEKNAVLIGSSLCFQSISFGELSINNRKVIGSAQKKWKEGFLQQGSILMSLDADSIIKIFKGSSSEKIKATMTGLMDEKSSLSPERTKDSIIKAFEKVFQVKLVAKDTTAEEYERALTLQRKKYRSEEWTFLR